MTRWPDFFLVGAPKCATGTIYELLGRSPQLFLAAKDVSLLRPDLATTQPHLSTAEYEARFKAAPAGVKLGDSSVGYLCSELRRAKSTPAGRDAKIVIALRNPLDAIPSLHRHCLYYGLEEIEDLGAALAAEEDRAQGRRLPRRCAHPWMLRYRHVYKYAAQVQRYFDAFGRSRCHIVIYDDFRADPEAAMDGAPFFPWASPRRSRDGPAPPPGRRPGEPGPASAQPPPQRPAHRPTGAGEAGRATPDSAVAAAARLPTGCWPPTPPPGAPRSTRPCEPGWRTTSPPRWTGSRQLLDRDLGGGCGPPGRPPKRPLARAPHRPHDQHPRRLTAAPRR